MVINFQRNTPHVTPVSIEGLDIEMVGKYIYLVVHLNNELDYTDNTGALYKEGQSRLQLLRRMRSFGVLRTLLKTFHDTVVTSAFLFAVVCWRRPGTVRDLTNCSGGPDLSWTVHWTP